MPVGMLGYLARLFGGRRQERSGGWALQGGPGVFLGLSGDVKDSLIVNDGFEFAQNRAALELSPAVNVVARVVGRVAACVPMRLVRPNGDEYDVRRGHPLLDLWNEAPNEFQTAASFREQVAQEMIYCGEAILRVERSGGGREPSRLYLWDASTTSVNVGQGAEAELDTARSIYYQHDTQTVPLDPDLPGIVHARQNVHPRIPLRGRPACYGMAGAVYANIYAAAYRREVFRQGGPPRLTLTAADQEEGNTWTDENARQAAGTFSKVVKSAESYIRTPVLPPGFSVSDLGPKGADPLMVSGARHTDELILAVYGVPVSFANNLERSTYSNVRTQDRMLVRDAVAPLLKEIGAALHKAVLAPMGGVNARLRVEWDTDVVLESEPAVYNKLIIDRVNAGLITPGEAREALGYDPEGAPAQDGDADDADDADDAGGGAGGAGGGADDE